MVNDGDIQRHTSPPAAEVLIGHAGASATLWWSVQLNLLGGTLKGQSFLAAIALERKQGSWVKERNITNVPPKRQATEHSCNETAENPHEEHHHKHPGHWEPLKRSTQLTDNR